MTTEEKTALSGFLNLTSDYLRGGYARSREEYAIEDETPHSSLPLAYTLEESAEESEGYNEGDPNSEDSKYSLDNIAAQINACQACGLAATRTKAVPGEGAARPLVMVIGEGPGEDEDSSGRPFVGKACQLLDRMLASIALFRDKNCFIANIVKCRPPGNRDPAPDEIEFCFPHLERQILQLRPNLILCVGRVASRSLLKTGQGINALRGSFVELKIGDAVIPVLPTFHPSALLRDESNKRPAWEDLKLLRSRLASINEEYAASLEKSDGE